VYIVMQELLFTDIHIVTYFSLMTKITLELHSE